MPTTAGAKPGQDERPATNRRHDMQTTGGHAGNNLVVRYGAIGIPAVAAALRYTVAAKNPAYAPVVVRFDPRLAEMAA